MTKNEGDYVGKLESKRWGLRCFLNVAMEGYFLFGRSSKELEHSD